MKIASAQLRNFRNHTETELEFKTAANALLGENGQGKTNVLEALSYLCLTKSFYAANDGTVVQQGKDFFDVRGTLLLDHGTEQTIRVSYDAAVNRRRYFVGEKEIVTFSSVIGKYPIVILSPENSSITFGTPADRRKFIDLTISQSSKVYIDDALEYRRTLRQRNKILSEAARKKMLTAADKASLEPWTEALVTRGAKIILKRAQFLREFAPYVSDAYAAIVEDGEAPATAYEPQIACSPDDSAAAVEERYRRMLEEKRADEIKTGASLVGPHRDEIAFSLNGLRLRTYSSQGQHKTFLVGLKIAEFFYLKERCSETPVFLLDDVFSELDDPRSTRLVGFIENLAQTFITATSESVFRNALQWNDERQKIFIRNGAPVSEREMITA
ncbi:MAG: DNA replication/repair protein RecF [Bacteroidota bacterium]|nr:DNA replication/repair protein RecF [Bacteroidota bacterium]